MDEPKSERLTYGSYLAVQKLTSLQNPLAAPNVRGDGVFIIGQQVQELWFKQILYDLAEVIRLLDGGYVYDAVRLLDRINRILTVLAQETELLQTLPPAEFKTFRPILSTASGFESEQFRELEWASGLREPHSERLVTLLSGGAAIVARWPRSLRDALCSRDRCRCMLNRCRPSSRSSGTLLSEVIVAHRGQCRVPARASQAAAGALVAGAHSTTRASSATA